jgi:hypothetical protein
MDPDATAVGRRRGSSLMAARFRDWRSRNLPRSSYRLAAQFWTSAGLRRAEQVVERGRASAVATSAADPSDALDLTAAHRQMVKSSQPQVTGMAWTARRVFLVVVATAAGYEHVAKLAHCRSLMRADPDCIEHHGKRVSALLLCDQIQPAIADFARRCRVRVAIQGEKIPAEIVTRTVTSSDNLPAAELPDALKPFSP